MVFPVADDFATRDALHHRVAQIPGLAQMSLQAGVETLWDGATVVAATPSGQSTWLVLSDGTAFAVTTLPSHRRSEAPDQPVQWVAWDAADLDQRTDMLTQTVIGAYRAATYLALGTHLAEIVTALPWSARGHRALSALLNVDHPDRDALTTLLALDGTLPLLHDWQRRQVLRAVTDLATTQISIHLDRVQDHLNEPATEAAIRLIDQAEPHLVAWVRQRWTPGYVLDEAEVVAEVGWLLNTWAPLPPGDIVRAGGGGR